MTHTKRRLTAPQQTQSTPARQHGSPIGQMSKPIKQMPIGLSIPFKLQ